MITAQIRWCFMVKIPRQHFTQDLPGRPQVPIGVKKNQEIFTWKIFHLPVTLRILVFSKAPHLVGKSHHPWQPFIAPPSSHRVVIVGCMIQVMQVMILRSQWKEATFCWIHQAFQPRKKNPGVPYFPLNPGCLIEILVMVFHNPYITG